MPSEGLASWIVSLCRIAIAWLLIAGNMFSMIPADGSEADIAFRKLGNTPYQVQLAIAISPGMSADLSVVRNRAMQSIESRIGPSWNVRETISREQSRNYISFLAGAEDVQAKVWLDRDGHDYVIATSIIQTRLGYDSGWSEVRTRDPREWPELMVSGLFQQFCPLGRIDLVEDQFVRFEIQGGEFPYGNEDWQNQLAGSFWQAELEFYDNSGKPQKRVPVPWTYLKIGGLDGSLAEASLYSGLKRPFGTKGSGRLQLWVHRIQPRFPVTDVQLVSSGRRSRPLPLHAVDVSVQSFEEPRSQAEPTAIERRGPYSTGESRVHLQNQLTNRRGTIEIPRLSDRRELAWLTIWSGNSKLATVPVLPGVERNAVLELPDDSIRLEAENSLNLIEADLIDAVARRGALIASVRREMRLNQLAKAKAMRRELETLPTPADFRGRIAAVRGIGVLQAREAKDRVAELKVIRLCDDANALIEQHLKVDRIRLLNEELDELIQAGIDAANEASKGQPSPDGKPQLPRATDRPFELKKSGDR